MIELAERLNDLAPGDAPKKAAFFTSGAEAVENAIKLARAFAGRNGVISLGGSFHGRTFMAMAITGKMAPYKAGFGAMMPDIYHVPLPRGAMVATKSRRWRRWTICSRKQSRPATSRPYS